MKAPVPMAGIFISYRREDVPGHAGRVFDRVRARFGADVVFMDVTTIDAGVDFVDAIDAAVGTCDVLLAIIGPRWAAADPAGGRRLDSPTDFVRLEIAGALKRNVRVVPVLVDGARLPVAADLPEDLQPLRRRNAIELRDSRWDADIQQLLASLERIVTSRDARQLQAPARRRPRARTVAALAAVVASVVAAGVYGPRACAPAPPDAAITAAPPASAEQTPADTPETPRETESASRPPTPPAAASSAPRPAIPDVVGRPLQEARDTLRRAGVDVARVLYRDDRTKKVDVVVLQTDVPARTGSRPAVTLTAVARASVMIRHRPEDAGIARGLLQALSSSPATAGLAIQTVETAALRPDAVARVAYGDDALAATAGAIAKDANAWLQRTVPERPLLTAFLYAPVVARTIVIGLPEASGTSSSSGSSPVPDVRGLTLGEARRALEAAGLAIAYKWSDDGNRKAFLVLDQSEVIGRTSERTVVLQVVAKGTAWVYHRADDSSIVERFARDLQSHMNVYGILVRLVPQPAVDKGMVGVVASEAFLVREARTIATFASSWFAKELGHPVPFRAAAGSGGPRRLTLGIPRLQ